MDDDTLNLLDLQPESIESVNIVCNKDIININVIYWKERLVIVRDVAVLIIIKRIIK